MADQVLYSGIACIVDLIIKEGLINLDFADVRTVMSGMGTAMMGTGEASGDRRATLAAEEAHLQSAARRRLAQGREGPAALDHRRPEPHALRGRRGREPRAPGGRSRSQHHRRRDVRRHSRRSRARVDRGLGHGARREPRSPSAAATGCGAVRASEAPTGSGVPYDRPMQRPADAARPLSRRPAVERSEALQRETPAHAPCRGGRPPPAVRETWHAPGNVVIERGPPQLSPSAPLPPPLPLRVMVSGPSRHAGLHAGAAGRDPPPAAAACPTSRFSRRRAARLPRDERATRARRPAIGPATARPRQSRRAGAVSSNESPDVAGGQVNSPGSTGSIRQRRTEVPTATTLATPQTDRRCRRAGWSNGRRGKKKPEFPVFFSREQKCG